jgi:hypothetical protein
MEKLVSRDFINGTEGKRDIAQALRAILNA